MRIRFYFLNKAEKNCYLNKYNEILQIQNEECLIFNQPFDYKTQVLLYSNHKKTHKQRKFSMRFCLEEHDVY